MDDDEFGGFEAAEAFDSGDGEKQIISPAVPWAVAAVHVPKNGTADCLLELSKSSACLSSTDVFMLSGDNTLAEAPASNTIAIKSAPPEQVQPTPILPVDEVPVSSLKVIEKSSLEKLTNAAGDADPLESKRLAAPLQQIHESQELKLEVSEEEKGRMKKELEDLLEKHRIMEIHFLKEKDDEISCHRDRYRQLQEVHKNELEEMRKAGHDALTIIVEEFKALLQSSVQQQGEASERHYQGAMEKQSQKCEELLNVQYQRLRDLLDEEKERFEQKMKDAFAQQLQEHKEALGTCLAEERQRNKEELEAAVKVEQEVINNAIKKAVEEERQQMEKAKAKEKESWEMGRKKDQEVISQAIEEALCEERRKSQDLVKSAIAEEQKRSQSAVQEAVRQTREELMEYITEQKRLDQVARQRTLSSLELFLSCAQKQLASLIEPAADEKATK